MIDWTTVITAAIAGVVAIAGYVISAWVTYKVGYHNGRSYQALAEAKADRKVGAEMRAADTVPVHTAVVAGSGNPGAGSTTKEDRTLGQ